MSNKWVYLFREVKEAQEYAGTWEGVRGLLGGKGANLANMTTHLKLPVPPGFTVTTEACNAFLEEGERFPEGMWEQVLEALKKVEKQTGKQFGDPGNPLLVSCRSGAKESMPGMMDTVLNIGLNDETALGLLKQTEDETFVFNSYRRLVQMFGSVVLEIPDEEFEQALTARKGQKGVRDDDTKLDAEDWKALTREFKDIIREHKGFDFPQDPMIQLKQAVEAVFRSWNGAPAVNYRNFANIAHDLGTGVNVQTMVFGNLGWDSGTGVAFTRNPSTGENTLYGEYLLNAQGEDVVAGIRTPNPIAKLAKDMPGIYDQFTAICEQLENEYHEMQDIEFTVERQKLWILQTRKGKRTPRAAVKIAMDLINEGHMSRNKAILSLEADQANALLHPQFIPKEKKKARDEKRYLTKGVNASPGAAVGIVALDADLAEEWGKNGKDVIMVRPETKPDDVHGMQQSKGILTSRGGATSHAAVVARQYGKPAVVGCEEIKIDQDLRQFQVKDQIVREGDWLSLDGAEGEVFIGQIGTEEPNFEEEVELQKFLKWSDDICAQDDVRKWAKDQKSYPNRGLEVWTNVDLPEDARRARGYGARGIGLTRTEHMFFGEERLPTVQAMILAKTSEERNTHLDKLLPFQRADFEGLFEAMDGLPVIIRLIDPPLHEFLPDKDELMIEIKATELQLEAEQLLAKIKKDENREYNITALERALAEQRAVLEAVKETEEANPMMGLRGIRLGITMPEITQMQVRAIFEAACNVAQKGVHVHPEIMIPLTGHYNELGIANELLVPVAKEVMREKGITIDYKFGTMIEVPRAAITAGEIAEHAEFFSFGTNDLTQMTFGYSRDDAEGKYLTKYVEGIDTGKTDARGKEILSRVLPRNPFQALDREGVGKLVAMAVREGRKIRPDLEVGICGEHGGDPSSIEFCHMSGLNYVSCDPYRVPGARLAAAQAVLKHQE